MKMLKELIRSEPVATIGGGSWIAFLVACFATLRAFGIELTDDQEAALLQLAVAGSVIAVPVLGWIRSRVTPWPPVAPQTGSLELPKGLKLLPFLLLLSASPAWAHGAVGGPLGGRGPIYVEPVWLGIAGGLCAILWGEPWILAGLVLVGVWAWRWCR